MTAIIRIKRNGKIYSVTYKYYLEGSIEKLKEVSRCLEN